VLFGFCRDIDALKELGLPFFSLGACPKVGTKNQVGEIGGALTIDGVTIHEGDYVIGDGDGIVFLSGDELTNALPRAITIMEKEKFGLEQMTKNNATINDVFNFREHYEKLLSGENSALTLL
jgi:regulator of RNase E activity RraA